MKDSIYLTVGKNPKGKGLLAIISLGSPQLGDKEIVVLTCEVVSNMKEAKRWFKQMKIEQPWEQRH